MFSRQTFTLRELGTSIGSYIKYDTTNFSAASTSDFVNSEFFLSAGPTSYGVNTVSWYAPTFPTTSVLMPADVYIRWSTTGEPQTVEEGFPLVIGALESGTAEHDLSGNTAYQGNWMYYSMFLRSASTLQDPYRGTEQLFEKVASVSVLMPKDYKSVEELWTRIPEYFRIQDNNNDLYNYLAVFGWDLDQLRTIIDYLMVQRDPLVASSFSLQYLMEELGTLITTLELGATRARQYMQDIINLRLAKGTEEGFERAIQAISGCRVNVDQLNKKINIYPQRVNWARDPRLLLGLEANWYKVTSDSTSVRFSNDYVQFNHDATKNYVTFSGASVAFNPARSVVNEGNSAARVYVIGRYAVPVESSDTFYFSAENPSKDIIHNVGMYYTDGSLAASAGYDKPDTVITNADGRTYFKMSVGTAASASAYLLITAILQPGQYALFDRFLLEKNFMGNYFDGYTTDGGWVRDSDERSDYRWHNNPTTPAPAPYTTFGIYTADAWRVRKTISNIYRHLIPVNWENVYNINNVVFDYMPSYSATPVDYTTPAGTGLLVLVMETTSNVVYELVFPSNGASINLGWPNIL